jgi:hypothetical protein
MSRRQLVAEARADCNLMAAFGAPAAQHRCARLGLHPGKEPVGLRAVSAVRLKGTLRHLTSTPCSIFLALQQSLSIPEVRAMPKGKSQGTCKEKALQIPQALPLVKAKKRLPSQRKSFFTRNGANKILSPDPLKIVRFSVLLSNPLTKDDFTSGNNRTMLHFVVLLRKGVVKPKRRTPATSARLHPPRSAGRDFSCL